MKPNKGNWAVILDRKLYNNAVEVIISDSSNFEKLNEDPTFKRIASLQSFLRKLKQKNVLMKLNMIRCIILLLLLLVSMVLLKRTNSALVIRL